ncbi:uncharacterized protein LOC118815050 [Colossoma macropomum]|uniref:uncharacterized protein LOC118815050 n=1 Tax=Colossoma macropomum TaxID=42526 RepID=UPI001863EE56|nr:uncharacterized protein LOC118815050 [Colossoma macropomum]
MKEFTTECRSKTRKGFEGYKERFTHQFQCPHTGQFQCRLTNLVFEMEGEGEVFYRIDFWDTRLLDGLGQMEPAGPLYNIDCIDGLISHLHLPHCEIQYEGNQAELEVAHFTGENVEVIPPLKVTNTHVIISIQGLSLFGLLKKILHPGPISAQVLLFYKEMMCKEIRKKLHIHLLPGNVPVEEVEKKHKGATYFETSSTCQLIAGRKYKPSCDHHVSEPKVARFVRDYGPNYHPTFVVFLQAEDITLPTEGMPKLMQLAGASILVRQDICILHASSCQEMTAPITNFPIPSRATRVFLNAVISWGQDSEAHPMAFVDLGKYRDLQEVCSKKKVQLLPFHRPYDLAKSLLPGTSPPQGQLFYLSAPECKAMEDYIQASLAQGIIQPLTSPVGAGFFFVGKKDGGFCSCIDS